MTYKKLSPIVLLFSFFAMANFADAGIIALYDGTNETEPNGSDLTNSVVNTPSTTNSLYNTRSFNVAGNQNVAPHESGVVPSSNGSDGHMYMRSAVTNVNHSINQNTSAYHDFKITVDDVQLELDTLSFNYWATEAIVNDAEQDTDYTYNVRAHADVFASNGNSVSGGYNNLSLTPTSGNNTLRIQNSNQVAFTPRSNVVEFNLKDYVTNTLGRADGLLDQGEMLSIRLSFADQTTGGGAGPDDGSHIHRLDNVQIETVSAIPEPSALCLLLGSFGILGLRRRR